MAIVWRGLDPRELAALTDAMLDSGDRLRFDGFPLPRVDKHSTGGVGDKVSLLLAPMVACCGVAVPMMSGRGLGHTGGTLDKLESIPGFRTGLALREARAQIDRLGCVMLGQTPEIAPADRRLYALRDVTATVESIPLISASIMSKKLAEGLNGLVLDVKTGSGAFLPEPARADGARADDDRRSARCAGARPSRCSPRWTGRWAARAATRSKWRRRSRGCGARARRSHGGHLRARRRDAACWSGPRRTTGGGDARRLEEAVSSGAAIEHIRAGGRGPGRESGGGRRSRAPAAGTGGGGLPRAPPAASWPRWSRAESAGRSPTWAAAGARSRIWSIPRWGS